MLALPFKSLKMFLISTSQNKLEKKKKKQWKIAPKCQPKLCRIYISPLSICTIYRIFSTGYRKQLFQIEPIGWMIINHLYYVLWFITVKRESWKQKGCNLFWVKRKRRSILNDVVTDIHVRNWIVVAKYTSNAHNKSI